MRKNSDRVRPSWYMKHDKVQSDFYKIICEYIPTLGDTGFFRLRGTYQGKSTVSGVFEDLKFTISECSDQN